MGKSAFAYMGDMAFDTDDILEAFAEQYPEHRDYRVITADSDLDIDEESDMDSASTGYQVVVEALDGEEESVYDVYHDVDGFDFDLL